MPRNDGNSKRPNVDNITIENLKKIKNKKNLKRNKKVTAPIQTTKAKKFVADMPEGKYGPAYEYKMCRSDANDILKECSLKVKPEQYLCDYVTDQYGLRGWCCGVIISDE